MKWLTYLSDNKNTLIIAISGALLADCIVLFAFRRYFSTTFLSNREALDVLRADVAKLRSEVLTLRSIIEEISGTNGRSGRCPNDNEKPHYYLRSKGFLGNSTSALSLSSDGNYYDAVDEWFEKRGFGDVPVYESEICAELIPIVDGYLEEQNCVPAYNLLKGALENDISPNENSELLWRLAKACKMYANTFEKSDPMKKNLVLEGRDYAVKACSLSPESFEPVRWAALMTGLVTDYVSMKEKIVLGREFKEYLDKAIGMRSDEISLLYMRGRYSYAVANLSWFEKKAASALFGNVPQATFDEAIEDFLAVERIKPGAWIDNLLFLGKCYIAKKDEENAIKYLLLAKKLIAENDTEKESMREVYSLLEKYQK